MGKIKMLDPDDLPWDLGKLGIVIEAELVMPAVYDAVVERRIGPPAEVFLVHRNAADISASAKRFGQPVEDHPDYLAYMAIGAENARYIIGYEILRYKILHHLPLPEQDTILSVATIGAEMYPDYFGSYPAPIWTPWGRTTRYTTIANGLFWLETEQCQRGLAVAYPRYDDLSDGASSLAEQFRSDMDPSEEHPPHRFFREANSSVPLFELLHDIPAGQIVTPVDQTALMNSIYQHHPEYAIAYNVAEQAGLHDTLGMLLNDFGVQTERIGDNEQIRVTPQAGTEFIRS